MDDYMKASEAAVILGVSAKTVVRMAKSGKLRSSKIADDNGPWLVSRQDVEALAEERAK